MSWLNRKAGEEEHNTHYGKGRLLVGETSQVGYCDGKDDRLDGQPE